MPRLHKALRSHPLLLPLLLLLAINLLAVLAPAIAPELPALPVSCARQVPLSAHSEMTLLRHHQWLETPPNFDGQGLSVWQLYPYMVVDTRTGARYPWSVEDVDRASGQIRFSVLTRWSLLHSNWVQDPWLLLYDCQPLQRP